MNVIGNPFTNTVKTVDIDLMFLFKSLGLGLLNFFERNKSTGLKKKKTDQGGRRQRSLYIQQSDRDR